MVLIESIWRARTLTLWRRKEFFRRVGDLAFLGIRQPRPLSELWGHYFIVKVCPDPNTGCKCHVPVSGVRARARAGNQPWRLLCGEKIHRPPSLFSPVLNTSDRWSFQYNLAEGALGLLRVECHVFPHRVRVRRERGITKCRSFTKHESRQFPSLSPAEAGSVRAEVGGAMSAQGCNRICEARARKEKAT